MGGAVYRCVYKNIYKINVKTQFDRLNDVILSDLTRATANINVCVCVLACV